MKTTYKDRKVIERKHGRYAHRCHKLMEDVENFVNDICDKYQKIDLFDMENIVHRRLSFAFSVRMADESVDEDEENEN